MQTPIVPATAPEVLNNAMQPLRAAQQPGSYIAHTGPVCGALAQLYAARRWLLWRYGPPDANGKPAKVPYYAGGGTRGKGGELDTAEDIARLAPYAQALSAAHRLPGVYAGLGFALGDGWQGIDLDDVSENRLARYANELPSYVEVSPSGKGCHAIGYGRPFRNMPNFLGIEAYSGRRFFTVTAQPIRIGPIVCIADYVERVLVPVHRTQVQPDAPSIDEGDVPATRDDNAVMRSFWYASNAQRFHALWYGVGCLRAEGYDQSRADQALITQLAFYTPNNAQLIRLFHASALGRRDKAWRDDYIALCVRTARRTHAPRLKAMALVAAAMAPALDAVKAKGRAK